MKLLRKELVPEDVYIDSDYFCISDHISIQLTVWSDISNYLGIIVNDDNYVDLYANIYADGSVKGLYIIDHKEHVWNYTQKEQHMLYNAFEKKLLEEEHLTVHQFLQYYKEDIS